MNTPEQVELGFRFVCFLCNKEDSSSILSAMQLCESCRFDLKEAVNYVKQCRVRDQIKSDRINEEISRLDERIRRRNTK